MSTVFCTKSCMLYDSINEIMSEMIDDAGSGKSMSIIISMIRTRYYKIKIESRYDFKFSEKKRSIPFKSLNI